MGDGLIQRQFKPIEKALETELAFLQQNGFEQAYKKPTEEYQASGFEKDQYQTSKTVLSEKYGASVYQNYKYIHDIQAAYMPLASQHPGYEMYKKQLELYAEDAELEYKPFAILKVVYENGRRLPAWKTSEMYSFLTDDNYLVLDLADPRSYELAELYFSRSTIENHMEGVVIRPKLNERWYRALYEGS